MIPPTTRRPASSHGVTEPAGYSSLPKPVRDLLAAFPSLRIAFDRLGASVSRDLQSRRSLLLLLAKWNDTVPPSRGVIKDLRDFMQLPIELDSGARSEARRLRRRQLARKRSPEQ